MTVEIKTINHAHCKTYHVYKDGKFVETYDYLCNARQRKRELEGKERSEVKGK